MATSYTYNGITFSNITSGRPLGGKYGNANNDDFTFENSNVYQAAIQPFVNAVEIDWNGAVVGENKTLNTTGEVLSRYKVAI